MSNTRLTPLQASETCAIYDSYRAGDEWCERCAVAQVCKDRLEPVRQCEACGDPDGEEQPDGSVRCSYCQCATPRPAPEMQRLKSCDDLCDFCDCAAALWRLGDDLLCDNCANIGPETHPERVAERIVDLLDQVTEAAMRLRCAWTAHRDCKHAQGVSESALQLHVLVCSMLEPGGSPGVARRLLRNAERLQRRLED